MPDSNQNPQAPNFVPGVGRLVTDRFDFEAHILGTNFRHNADAIDVIPGLVVGGHTYTNVLTALEALAAAAEPPVIAPATQTMLGVIQLTRDLGGVNGTSPLVIGLQGRSVSNQTPVTGNVLTWTGSAWTPSPIVGLFTPGADLGGSSPASSASLQYVSGLTGSSGTVNISANNLTFGVTTTPYTSQAYGTTSGSTIAKNMTVKAQGLNSGGSATPNDLSGNLVLAGGAVPSGEGGGGTPGGVILSVGGDPFISEGGTVFQVAQVPQSSGTQPTVAVFFPGTSFSGITSADIPNSIGGNDFIYIGDTVDAPIAGATTGTLLWSQNGKLNIMQEDNTTFVVGSIPNPSTWGTLGPTDAQTITYRSHASSSTSAGTNIFSSPIVTIPNNTSARIDCIFVAKVPSNTPSAQYNVSMGFINNGGTVALLGTNTSTDPRTLALIGQSWNVPVISNSGANLNVFTGWYTGASANWTVITQITLSPQQ